MADSPRDFTEKGKNMSDKSYTTYKSYIRKFDFAEAQFDKLPLEANWKSKVFRNIGAALGAESPKEELKIVAIVRAVIRKYQ